MSTKRRQRKRQFPTLPVRCGKAHMMLLGAMLTGDNEQAAWVDAAVLAGQVLGTPDQLDALEHQLDEAMGPRQPKK